MSAFNRAFHHVLGIEGDYSDDKNDRGGKTRFGITEAVARAHGYLGEMKDLPIEVAHKIYKAQYWDLLRLDDIAALSEPIAEELFDTAVNCGVGIAGSFLQRALNAFNRLGADYPDVKADGIVGPMTVSAFKGFMYRRAKDSGEAVMLRALNSLQGARYVAIAEADHSQESFTFGWYRARVA